jgi:RNA polymerase sigma-70 factor (ECF subfamily)
LGTEDPQLVRKTLAGDRDAFTALVDRYRNLLCGLAYHHLGSFEDAQDVAQDVLLYAYRHLRELRDPGKLGAWLRRVTLSHCADRLRRPDRRHVSLELADPVPCRAWECDGRRAHPGDGPEQWATRLAIRQALARLSEKTRLAVTLFYLGGFSHGEIAAFLEIPVNTVRSRLRIAKRQLREEMLTMVEDVLSAGRPDPEFTRRVVDEAIRRAEAAVRANAAGEAYRQYGEALSAIESLPTSEEQRRLKMETLWKQGNVSRFHRGFDEARRLHAEALAIADTLGDRRAKAERLLSVAGHAASRAEAEEQFRQALAIYRDLGDLPAQGECLFWVGIRRIQEGELAMGKPFCEEALPLLEAADDLRLAAVCRGMLALLAEHGLDAFPTLLAWNASCDTLTYRDGVYRYGLHSEIRHTLDRQRAPHLPELLGLRTAFAHLAPMGTLLDTCVPVNESWSGDAWSYSSQPLRTAVTVQSASERVTVPAGTFDHCLLTEQVTMETNRSDVAPPENRDANRRTLCGVRRAWYAPGVGLVQLQAVTGDGEEALLQLQASTVAGDGDAYLPLTTGNTWTYAWAGLPTESESREVYRVTAQDGEKYYVESYGYLRPRPRS